MYLKLERLVVAERQHTHTAISQTSDTQIMAFRQIENQASAVWYSD